MLHSALAHEPTKRDMCLIWHERYCVDYDRQSVIQTPKNAFQRNTSHLYWIRLCRILVVSTAKQNKCRRKTKSNANWINVRNITEWMTHTRPSTQLMKKKTTHKMHQIKMGPERRCMCASVNGANIISSPATCVNLLIAVMFRNTHQRYL